MAKVFACLEKKVERKLFQLFFSRYSMILFYFNLKIGVISECKKLTRKFIERREYGMVVNFGKWESAILRG